MSTLSIKAVAEILDVSEQRVRTLCRDGVLRSEKFGRSWMIDANSLADYQRSLVPHAAEDNPAYRARQHKPVALSFFSGAMGLDQGIEQAGFDIRLACEMDRYCRQTIALNRPDIALIGDINQYSADEVLAYAGLTRADDVDLIVGGPPCQAFSTAGKRKGFNDDRGNAFISYLELAFDIRQKFVVIENVRGLLSSPMNHRPHDMRGAGFLIWRWTNCRAAHSTSCSATSAARVTVFPSISTTPGPTLAPHRCANESSLSASA